MQMNTVVDEILKKAFYITDARKKINKLKDLLVTVSDLLEDSEEADVRKLADHLNHGTQYIQEMIGKAKRA